LHIIKDSILGKIKGPFTLGHENAGWVEEMGQAVTGYKKVTPLSFMARNIQKSENLLLTQQVVNFTFQIKFSSYDFKHV
jgi:NADPH:quinone reductase-like Zn-dependent oxidoreductase